MSNVFHAPVVKVSLGDRCFLIKKERDEMMLNKVILIGRLTRKPELRYTTEEKAVTWGSIYEDWFVVLQGSD